ncbi:ParB N-terminal domain-containing protein [Gemmiger formicilis]|uniref:ParB N-terminal domain-containing protein n=1 Tax=Gemmiger formicilis TaxID=745368 RepID=UPI003CCAF934
MAYEIISGHRRFHAAQLAGLTKSKCRCGMLMTPSHHRHGRCQYPARAYQPDGKA